MDDKKFMRIGEILPAILKSIGLDKKLKEREILSLWPAVVGEEVAARAHAERIERGVLYVSVDHGAWMQELHFMEKDILRKLRDRAPNVQLHKIRFGAPR